MNSDDFLLQCVPLYTLLAALGHPTVNWFILDIEGAELQVNNENFTHQGIKPENYIKRC